MVNKRIFWLNIINTSWKRKNIIWLSGVRRAGKTFLCRNIAGAEFFDCELPSVRAVLENPESFLKKIKGKHAVIDEIHRLSNPAELLKIAADYFPDTKIIATGSSSLSASKKFKDTLTGRKTEIWLTPMTLRDLSVFKNEDIEHRLLNGGLPPHFMSKTVPERECQEWMDNYWAKDIQELFQLEKRYSFLKFAELIMVHSGGIFEATAYAAPCEVSRATISNYLSVLEATYVANIIRPFSGRSASEIISASKVYAFDTGFVCAFRGINALRSEDKGLLWEHLVLNEMHAHLRSRKINYWRDKQGHEVDFVYSTGASKLLAIECKWSEKEFSPKNLKIFVKHYRNAECFAICSDTTLSHTRDFGGLKVTFLGLSGFAAMLSDNRNP